MNAALRNASGNFEERSSDAVASSAERLADLQLAFNLYPSRYVHPSWLVRLGIVADSAEEGRELQASPLWIRAVSSALLRSECLDQHFDCDFFDPAKRLALLDATTLTHMAGLVSAVLLRERVKRVVRQDEVRTVHACMGAEAHVFAVRWAGLLPMVNPIIADGDWPTRAQWERASVTQLSTVMPAHAIGVIGRLRMRFPYEWPIGRQRLAEPQRVGFTRLIVAVILQCAPQWRWLFDSSSTGETRC